MPPQRKQYVPYTHVPSEGPRDAKIVVCGESPWINEVAAGRPFAGASGNLMRRWWEPLGLQRSQMRLMNLFPYQPPTREISSVPAERIIKAIEGVHARIAALVDPHVIIPMGNYATYALTGKGKVRAEVRRAFDSHFSGSTTEAEKKAGISQLRGSIYPYRDLGGRMIKVIPMIHPAAVLQMPKWEKRSIADWGRVKREAQFREIRDPGRRHCINPSQEEIAAFYWWVAQQGSALRMAVDIETWGNQLSCVGFAPTATYSITIPTIGRDKEANLAWVKLLCEGEAQKVLCNGSYDWYWLDAVGIQLRNYIWDVQSMHHALDPVESHSLDFLASIYCEHYVFWKDEAKEAEEIVKYAKDVDSLYVYNGQDCCYTRELLDLLEAQLRDAGMLDFYFQQYATMFEPLLRTMRYGIRVDVKAQRKAAKELKAQLAELHTKLNALAGCELFATETRTALREPTIAEWTKLAGPEYSGEYPPTTKYINREARAALAEQGLTYMIAGKNAGKIRYKVENLKKDFSTAKLMRFFYETLALPKQYKLRKGKNGGGKKKTEALDEDAIRKLMYRYPKAVEPGKLLLEYREKKKEYDEMKGSYDSDGRVRCSYKMLTVAGRLSSAKNPKRSGRNLQNLKR
ncbi:MAG: uracil-DNA glycosylase family protein [Candidatus Omnitrophota bacterium]